MGEGSFGIDIGTVDRIAADVKEARRRPAPRSAW